MGLDLHFYFLLILSFVHHFRYDTPFCMLNILNGMLQYLFGKLYPIKLWLTQFRVVSCDNARVLSTAMRKSILRDPQGQVNHARDYPPQAVRPSPSPSFASARASYPVFLAFHDTLKLQIDWAWRGLVDAFRWDIVIGLLTRNVCCPLPSLSCLCRSLTVYMQRCRSPRECAQVFLAQWHLPSFDLCL